MTGTVATEDPRLEDDALAVVRDWIDEFDRCCNRFRPDSEISRINASGGGTFAVSVTLERALEAALASANLTGWLCDPTVLASLEALGYDRDYSAIAGADGPAAAAPRPAPGKGSLGLDPREHTLTLRGDVRLDLGASAKALLADVVLEELASAGGALVEVGGDVALRGVGPSGPWVVGVASSLVIDGTEPRISLPRGGVATSSSLTRTWRRGGGLVNHIIDPRTGECANGRYGTATVAAPSCVEANAFATAALLWDSQAAWHITEAGHAARLVDRDGVVELVGGWPREEQRP
jgi:thiamine biosynthesis lipoprotein